ncbi:endonuclease/exonuclease/phosphatase family protein [Microbacterium sp. 18062]|uniref:endonuclease/exonuclease/phosphatase family protein n=1 Tax=Microbacterium sp. 18062 TaxID=2681410 RepID=UPI00135897B2|nr:endonuclease/exonuclease/phosphatase family protein [Microbacterium sp. 18062]
MTGALIGPALAPDLHVMTYNIRRRMDGPLVRPADRWREREPRMQRLLRAETPSVLGAQEVLPGQATALLAALGTAYRLVGHGRDRDGQGEGCPILYDTGRLELLAWEQNALSDTPRASGSRSWGNLAPRIAVSAEFRDLATGARFLHVNTHFDHLSRRSRVRSAEHIRRRVVAQPLPAIVTGDLNADAGSPPLRELFADDGLVDAWAAASEHVSAPWGTFGSYRTPRRDARRIDWIVVTPGITVRAAGINARRVDGRWPSDHLPVQAIVRIPAGRTRAERTTG